MFAAQNRLVRFRVRRLDLAPRIMIHLSIRVNRLDDVLGRGTRPPLILPLFHTLTPFRPLGYPVKVARRRRRVPAGAAPLVPGRVRVGRVLVIPLLGRARLHGDVDVTRVRARWNGRVVQRVNGSMGGAGLAAEVALQPLGRLEFPRLVLLLEIQRFPRQHVLTGREVLSWEAGMLVETSGSHGHG